MGLILGIDICDDYSQISSYDPVKKDAVSATFELEGSAERIPTVICKKKGLDEWLIGEEAYRNALLGSGTVIDSLIRLVINSNTATIEGVKYEAEELLQKYIEKIIGVATRANSNEEIDSIVFTVPEPMPKINDAIMKVASRLSIKREFVHIYSHTESFIYYILNQNREIWTNQVSLFDLRENGLFYYEFKAIRGRKPVIALANKEKLPEGFAVDVLDTPSGAKLGDSILSACANRVLKDKLVSTVLLTGRGFNYTDWSPTFFSIICNRRKVFKVNSIFADGAAIAAADLAREKSELPYMLVCEGRLPSTVTMQATVNGKKEQIVLASAGTSWYEASSSAQFILDDIAEIELTINSILNNKTRKVSVSLAELPARPNKTTKIELITSFTSENRMTIRVVDKGFGDLFPASDRVIREDFIL